jgi:hypothetical protein
LAGRRWLSGGLHPTFDDACCRYQKQAVRRRNLYATGASPLDRFRLQGRAWPGRRERRKLLATHEKGSDTQGSERRAVASMTSASEQKVQSSRRSDSFVQGMPLSRSTEILGFLGTGVRDKLEHGASSQGSFAESGSRRCLGNGGRATKHWIVDSRRSKRERRVTLGKHVSLS